MNNATNSESTDVVHEISHILFQAVWEQEQDLDKKVHELDKIINQLLRQVGLLVESLLLTKLANAATKKAKATGLTVHRCKRIKYLSLFGAIEIPSFYLWDKKTARGARPVKDQLRIEHGDRSVAVQRRDSDFGAEESFGQAAKRFEEHYGWAINRATVRARSRENSDKSTEVCGSQTVHS